jgi:RNA polymerase sigma-70 factor (ECF subfamily)
MVSSGIDCDEALAACARGDRRGLRLLYEHEAPKLMGVALRIVRRRDLADEVVHDAFVQIWQRAGSFDASRGGARAWIFSIVRHRAIDVVRGQRRETAVDAPVLEAIADSTADADDSLMRLADNVALRHCLGALDPRRRACILLAYVDGYTHEQIATRLSAPLGTVKGWIRRGLQALKECLG